MILTVGFTQSDRDAGYSSYCDGYRPGAQQKLVNLRVTDLPGITAEQWAEAVFIATNAPWGAEDAPQVTAVRAAIARAVRPYWRTLSKGDTVTVNGQTWACASVAWEPVPDYEAERPVPRAMVERARDA